MNITDLAIEDPRKFGQYKDPYVDIRVDEVVQEIGKPIEAVEYHGSSYRLVPCGPFMAAEYEVDGEWYDGAECRNLGYSEGVLNKMSLVDKQLIHVNVVSSAEKLDMVMPVERLRRLVRKYAGNTWVVIVDEQAALEGLLKWRLERTSMLCYGGSSPNQAHCRKRIAQTVVVKNTHLTVCAQHLQNLQSAMQRHRAAQPR